MASPQVEDGHLDIANELVEALARGCPGNGEGQVLWAIIRKTYGWHKKEDSISFSQIVELTGLSRRMVIYAIQNLEAQQIITVKRKRVARTKNAANIISLQKNYEKWMVQEKSIQYKNTIEKRKLAYKKSKEYDSESVVQEIEPVVQENDLKNRNHLNKGETLVVQENDTNFSSARKPTLVVQETGNDLPFLAPTKETFTKTNTKTKSRAPAPAYMGEFEKFWKEYPRKVGKRAAQKAWKKNGMPGIDKILEAIVQQRASPQWNTEGGRFIPNPATWLNQGRWDDEPLKGGPSSKTDYDVEIDAFKRKYGVVDE